VLTVSADDGSLPRALLRDGLHQPAGQFSCAFSLLSVVCIQSDFVVVVVGESLAMHWSRDLVCGCVDTPASGSHSS